MKITDLPERCDTLWFNANLLTLDEAGGGLGVIRDGFIACTNGKISHVGASAAMPMHLCAGESVNCGGRWIAPGLIDCHTHLVYAGSREDEFEMRLEGVSYEEIARAGGGIASTMQATSSVSEAQLLAASLPRLDALLAEGITTVEIKSGYGTSLDAELRQLRAARQMGRIRSVRVVTTFLAAHAVPSNQDKQAHIDDVCARRIPEVAGSRLADAVDAYCDAIGFSSRQVSQVFEAARQHNLPVKVHAEQLSHQGGAEMAARFGALSADHLEHLDEAGIKAMAASGTVAVLLPGAFYFTRETVLPPVEALRAHGVPIALATDCNPGTSPLTSPLLAMNMGATLFRLTVAECIAGFTREAARALGLQERTGRLRTGLDCDLSIWDISSPGELVYRMGMNPLHARVVRGSHLENE
ncbi:imidazolonepropionase [Pseudoxanthomonas indica]|uniref:Imidazolonepropionase n=1 Tax=Pseudoxanthomonas indica TaxID=428993 RepID=A0A1T5M1W1_9GAMM|nr:imidazolonepropionase [Pseudoxanthomonas indica]GGD60580.1 imidazolonepropionase [Pseudoxanthomonas indica]SKC82206.1 imidazolonepropionase [Pseudoxanthomonas indica]